MGGATWNIIPICPTLRDFKDDDDDEEDKIEDADKPWKLKTKSALIKLDTGKCTLFEPQIYSNTE